MTATEHNKMLGILFLIFGVLRAVGALFGVFFVRFFLSSMPGLEPLRFHRGIFAAVMAVMMIVSVVLAVPPLAAGYALLKRKAWSKMAGMVAAILSLISIPAGTALGIYALWFMTSEKGKNFYLYGEEQPALPPPPPQSWQ